MKHLPILAPLRGHRPRYADVAATLALLFAMGGTAYAATSIGPNTVGTAQLKDHAVTESKIDTHAVGTGRIAPMAVTNGKLADASVDGPKLADGSVTELKVGDFSVTNSKIGTGAVTNNKIGLDSIGGSNVAPNALSLADLVGGDTSGHIGFTLNASGCGTLNISVGGAQVGQVVLFSFTGNVAVPSSVTFGGSKVTAAGAVTVRACNHSASSFTVSNLGIRIVTFG
jgi:hypothetical protein